MTFATPMLAGIAAAIAIPALTIQTDTPIDTLLLDYLRKRGLLR